MEKKHKYLDWLFDPNLRILYHLLFWAYIYSADFLSLFGITDNAPYDWIFVSVLVADMVLVYTNLYLFMPKYLWKNKFWPYVGGTILSILVVAAFSFYRAFISEEGDTPTIINTVFLVGFLTPTAEMLALAVGIKVFKRLLKNQRRFQELKTSKLKTELAYLKQQINPHFLFNALNNIYVQSRKRPKEASEAILLLSDLLRYQLYDCGKSRVNLKDEIAYLENYLKLDNMRKNNSNINFSVTGMANSIKVAPFLFIPFLENAVKHGLMLDDVSFININFEILADKINFSIENSKPAQQLSNIQGGIGLVNVRRRLELLYPDRHNLRITNDKQFFKIELSLEIEPIRIRHNEIVN